MCTAIDLSKGGIELEHDFPYFNFSEKDSIELADDINDLFGGSAAEGPVDPIFNIRPTNPMPLVSNQSQGKLVYFRFGLIPSWSKDAKWGNKLFNARSESIAEKPSFRSAIKKRRCLIVATAFYEWPKYAKSEVKRPYRIGMQSGKPFAIAGIWEKWTSPNGEEIQSTAIITTQPNELISPYHHRMPVIIDPQNFAHWLSTEAVDPKSLEQFYVPYSAEKMSQYLVSNLVNNPRNKSAETILPYAED